MDLTICYITNRQEPKLEWFLHSLEHQLIAEGNWKDPTYPPYPGIELIIIDSHQTEAHSSRNGEDGPISTLRISPKPCIWSGPHRLTKEEWWSASSVRNTALCLCRTKYIAYVDDLSVLMPTWLKAVREAMAGNYIVCGAYQKVKKLEVEDGIVKGFEFFDRGVDCRWHQANGDITPCHGQWLFGCSVAGPVEAFLSVNGWPEDLCDGMGYEDCYMGIVLQNAGWQLKYDRRMKTLESEEDHYVGTPMKRADYGKGNDDKSHRALNIAKASRYFPNSYNIRELRDKVLAGEPFPIPSNPQHEWYTGTALKDL